MPTIAMHFKHFTILLFLLSSPFLTNIYLFTAIAKASVYILSSSRVNIALRIRVDGKVVEIISNYIFLMRENEESNEAPSCTRKIVIYWPFSLSHSLARLLSLRGLTCEYEHADASAWWMPSWWHTSDNFIVKINSQLIFHL